MQVYFQMRLASVLIILFSWLGSPGTLFSKHIIGGDMYYKCISVDTVAKKVNFRVTLKMYRDCSNPYGAAYDESAAIGIYEKLPNGTFIIIKEINARLTKPIKSIDPEANNPCLIIPPTVCVQEGIYEFETGTLPMISNSYYIAYQRCCRNETITNIVQPGDAGAAFTIEITPEAQRQCNNSPQFRNFPPVVICVNYPINFDHSVTDLEGDSVSYEFCAPLSSGGKDDTDNGRFTCNGVTPRPAYCLPPFKFVNFISPLYSTSYPMGGNPLVTINPVTGAISGKPLVQGQYVVGVCIREYRNGILLTETRRDFQFNVAFCEPKVFAKLQADSVVIGSGFVINSCGNLMVDFDNLSTDENYISSYNWKFNIQGVDQIVNTKNARFTFPILGTYRGKMILNEGTGCSDSANITVNIFPGLNADYSFTYDTCIAGPIVFKDKSVSGSGTLTHWNWNFSNAGNSIVQDPSFVFNTPGRKQVKLQITDINKCKDDTTISILYYPVPPLLIVDPSIVEGCTPLKVCFNNLSIPIDTTYKINWDFGDGTKGNQISPCHTYANEGLYSLKLELTSPIGCYTSRDYPAWISTRQSPEANFSFTPDQLNTFQRTARFSDLSNYAQTREWSFNDKDKSSILELDHTFRDTGLQKVSLIAINNNGCRDTLIKFIDLEPRVTLFMPNAFTPNGDSDNNEFGGVGIFEGMKDYEMTIWDRWGMKLFSTNDPLTGWNGRLDNNGSDLPNGVYVYLVRYKTPRDKVVEIKGFANLIR